MAETQSFAKCVKCSYLVLIGAVRLEVFQEQHLQMRNDFFLFVEVGLGERTSNPGLLNLGFKLGRTHLFVELLNLFS